MLTDFCHIPCLELVLFETSNRNFRVHKFVIVQFSRYFTPLRAPLYIINRRYQSQQKFYSKIPYFFLCKIFVLCTQKYCTTIYIYVYSSKVKNPVDFLMPLSYNMKALAGVMELADVPDSKSGGGDTVPVRPRSPAPRKTNQMVSLFLF